MDEWVNDKSAEYSYITRPLTISSSKTVCKIERSIQQHIFFIFSNVKIHEVKVVRDSYSEKMHLFIRSVNMPQKASRQRCERLKRLKNKKKTVNFYFLVTFKPAKP